MYLEILDMIADESGRNAKAELIEKWTSGNQLWENIFVRTYDTRLNYYIKQIPDYKPTDEPCVTMYDSFKLLDTLSSRDITGDAAKNALANTLSQMSEDNAKVLIRIILGNLKCGISGKTINTALDKELIYIHPYMSCQSFTENNMGRIVYPAYAQLKMDGLYLDIIVEHGKVRYLTRNGNELNIPQMDSSFIKLACGKNLVFQGECLIVDDRGNIQDRETGNGILNSDDIASSNIKIIVWDCHSTDSYNSRKGKVPYNARYDFLELLFKQSKETNIELVETRIINSEDEAYKYFSEVIARGEEGLIIKNFKAVLKDGKSPDQVKMKEIKECELVITSVNEGSGKYIEALGSFSCESSDGLLSVNVGTGFSDEDRVKMFDDSNIGKIISVQFNQVVSNKSDENKYSLFLPRFVEIRQDKTDADSYSKINDL